MRQALTLRKHWATLVTSHEPRDAAAYRRRGRRPSAPSAAQRHCARRVWLGEADIRNLLCQHASLRIVQVDLPLLEQLPVSVLAAAGCALHEAMARAFGTGRSGT